MSIDQSETAGDLLRIWETAAHDLPFASAKRLAGEGNDRTVLEAFWKGYDAWVRLANKATNQLYADPNFGSTMAAALENVLRLQHFSDSVAGAFFGWLWPAFGLPSTTEVRKLSTELDAVRAEIRAQLEKNGGLAPLARDRARAFENSVDGIWGGFGAEPQRERDVDFSA